MVKRVLTAILFAECNKTNINETELFIEAQAILSVMQNRLKRKWMGASTMIEVACTPFQFSGWMSNEFKKAWIGKQLTPYDKTCIKVIESAVDKWSADTVKGACFYWRHDVPESKAPIGIADRTLVFSTKYHNFYKNVR